MVMNKKNLHFALPDIDGDESEELLECLRRGWLTTGPKTALFEKGFADYLGMPYALAVNSGTAGLHLALEAFGIRKGDIVITSAYTFTACAEVIRYLGAHPALVDIERQTFNLNPKALEGKLEECKRENKSVKAVLPVHFAGQACDMEGILDLSREYGIRVIEDAAHALPCTHKGKMIGTIGVVGVSLMGLAKIMTTFGLSAKIALGPIGWLIAALELLYVAYKTNFLGIGDGLKVAWEYTKAFWEFIKNFATSLGEIFGGIGRMIKGVFNRSWAEIKEGFKQVGTAVKKSWNDAFDDVGKHVETAISQSFKGERLHIRRLPTHHRTS